MSEMFDREFPKFSLAFTRSSSAKDDQIDGYTIKNDGATAEEIADITMKEIVAAAQVMRALMGEPLLSYDAFLAELKGEADGD